ncbi:AAA family ATPase, partial [Photobacterium phosphoreum]|uniref:AAA family ATPase n=1 Tax=Photobacterium phosphoreum TaxID=659 RepID=UPI000D4056C1
YKRQILTLLNIAGSISDNCIICIDEPEISLHPKWQKEFMKVMIEFFSDFKKCHFIVATHSPLIISELSKENCFVLNMDSTTAKKALDYKNMSSDYQLVEVFGIPGNNNEYLNRLVVSLLSKLSKTGTLNEDDKIKLDELVKLSNDMDSYDTVKELINILNIAWCKVSDK